MKILNQEGAEASSHLAKAKFKKDKAVLILCRFFAYDPIKILLQHSHTLPAVTREHFFKYIE